jgi:hypothetical protein
MGQVESNCLDLCKNQVFQNAEKNLEDINNSVRKGNNENKFIIQANRFSLKTSLSLKNCEKKEYLDKDLKCKIIFLFIIKY